MMQHVPEFLRSVEARLRCPTERRPAVIEELRGHLADRVEALVQQGLATPDAERRAVREMGPVWLLALRLSAANGWNVTAHVLRELWAASLAFPLVTIVPQLAPALLTAPDVRVGASAVVGLENLVILAAAAAFGFAMGRTVRGWAWAAVAVLLAAANGFPSSSYLFLLKYIAATEWLAAGAAVLVSAVLGQRRESPRLQWLAWASVGLIALCIWASASIAFWLRNGGSPLYAATVLVREIALGVRAASGTGQLLRQLVSGVAIAAVPWLFWLGAWVIERAGRVPTVAAE